MYQVKRKAFGSYEAVLLSHEEKKDLVQVVPGAGACMTKLKLSGVELLDGYPDGASLHQFKWKKSAVLIPFPNRLLDGKYQWQGTTYQFPINETKNHHAIHGFVYDKPMQVVEEQANASGAAITCRYDYDGKLAYYPFPFQVNITFRLDANGLKMTLAVQNTGPSKMPLGTGWHPYFSFGQGVDTLELKMPAVRKIEVDDRLIPNGKITPFDEFNQMKRIGDTVLDNCFELVKPEGIIEFLLQSKTHRMRYWQEAGPDKFSYVQVFMPPHNESIAIEPMSCSIDAFNNKDGLILLDPGEKFEGSCGVMLKER